VTDLTRTLIVCGLLSGTQPLTLMALLLVKNGERGTRNGWVFLAGGFVVQSALLLSASTFVGGSVDDNTSPGKAFVILRIAAGLALIVVGLVLRRSPSKPTPEIPIALRRVADVSWFGSFVAAVLMVDYQGPVLASLAIATADDTGLPALAIFTLFASGIPIGVHIATIRSAIARARIESVTNWVMANRRPLASWFALSAGSVVAVIAVLDLVTIANR
jgi:Sap, sulfolipid-1-addressing protein